MPDGAALAGLWPLLMLAPLLCAVAYFDLRYMRIPNALCLISLGLFALACLVAPPTDLTARLVAAAAVFALGFAGFAFGLIGGGDVKMLACLMLFIPAAGVVGFAQIFALALAVGIAGLLALRAIPRLRAANWAGLSDQHGYPMGISISLAGLAYPLWAILAGA